MREVSDRIKALDGLVKEADARLEALLLQVPNLPHASVPVGRSADDNVEVRRWGAPRAVRLRAASTHWEIGEASASSTSSAASKIAKSRFTVMWGAARGSSGRSRSSCWISTPASTATPRSGCRTS